MSWVGDLIENYSQGLVPDLAGEYFPYTMDILTQGSSQDAGGDILETAAAVTYEGVPVALKLQGNVTGREPLDPITINNRYMMTFPVKWNGERITIDQETDFLRVAARGLEPVRVFKIEVPRNPDGVFYKVIGIEQ
jgi:hypothetical protein